MQQNPNKFISVSDIRRLEIGLTSLCNAGCPLCSRHVYGTSTVRNELPLGSMTYENFKKVTDELGSLTNNIELTLGGVYGDPIACPSILDILKYAVNFYKKITVDTNGGIKSVDFWKELGVLSQLHDNKLEVKFSIDGLSDTNSLYRINTSYEKIMDNARNFINAGGYASWKFIVFKHNEHQIDTAKKLSKEMNFKKFRILHTNRFPNGGKQFVESDAYSNKINSVVHYVTKSGFLLEPSSLAEVSNKEQRIADKTIINCKSIEQGYLYISHDFKLWPCCYFDGVRIYDNNFKYYWNNVTSIYGQEFNDLNKLSIQQILNSEYFINYLPEGWSGNKPRCQECFNICGSYNYRKTKMEVLEN
jgi:MoaA/NifB/PqqE/SkfB family radical SAM enzyme